MFEDATGDMMKQIELVRKKFKIIDKKVEELGEHTDDLHSSTDKLEAMYTEDIAQRKTWIEEHPQFKKSASNSEEQSQVDLRDIDAIFDELEQRESKSYGAIFLNIANLSMIGVIALTAYTFMNL